MGVDPSMINIPCFQSKTLGKQEMIPQDLLTPFSSKVKIINIRDLFSKEVKACEIYSVLAISNIYLCLQSIHCKPNSTRTVGLVGWFSNHMTS